jgi:hypothetical protein
VRVRPDVDIRPFPRRMQEGGRGADTQAITDGALGVGHALLNRAVVVGIARDAEAHRARHERFAKRVAPVHGGDGEIAVAPAIGIIALADAFFQPLEIGQHVLVTPTAIAVLRPGIEILPLAAIIDVSVDRRRTAERLAARRIDAAAAGPWPRLLLIRPS